MTNFTKTVIRIYEEEGRRGRAKGRAEGRIEVAKEML